MSILSSLIGVFTLCFQFSCAVAASPACQDTSYGRSCSLSGQIETLSFFNEKLMVGGSNSLLSFNLDLQIDEHVDLTPEATTVENCVGFGPGQLGNDPPKCTNFVKVIKRVSPGDDRQPRVMVCGTNAFRPKCTLHNALNISSYKYMTESAHVDQGFSPYSNDSQIVAILTSTGRFFSGTKFDLYTAPQTIGMAPYPLNRDNTFTVQVPTSNPQWLKNPTFVSSYEIGDHVYFFLREAAYEINQGESVVYSRAVRICKNDNGVIDPNEQNKIFQTFQKARMVCSSSSAPGSIAYDYDNLQSTFLWKSSDGEQFLYGVFTSPINGPSGSAICKFSFDPTLEGSLTKVFEDGDYLVLDDNQLSWKRMVIGSFVCPGKTNGTQRSISDAAKYKLVHNPVTAFQSKPIYTMFGKRLTNIVVDIVDYDGSSETIIYLATAEGNIHYIIIRNDLEKHEGIMYRTGNPLSDLTLHNSTDEKRNLYATSGDRILLITLGDCSRYTGCFGCLDSNDVYCGWDEGTSSCKNKLTFSSSLVQAALASEDDITRVCGPRPDVPLTQVPPSCQSTVSQTSDLRSESRTDDITQTPEVHSTAGLSPKSKFFSVPDLVGATVGAFVIGIPVGAFICFVFLKMFIRPRRHKHAINGQGRHGQEAGEGGNLNQVNNQLSDEDQQQIQKKDLSLKENPRYVQPSIVLVPITTQPKSEMLTLAPVPPGNIHSTNHHKRTNSKDINTYISSENETFNEPDHVPPLRSVSSCSGNSHSNKIYSNGHRRKVPGYDVPRGRTDSTTWLRANSESSDPTSPLESPISDV